MAFNQGDLSLPGGFNNVVRLFPLPNLVLFPGVVQALHIFEPRYRELMSDALADDELITMAYLKPSGISDPAFGMEPPIAETVCIGKIISHTELEDGRYNLFLVGTRRARIIEELDVSSPYRMAEVAIVQDGPAAHFDATTLRQQIIKEFRELAALETSWNHEALEQFLDDSLPLTQLIDMIAYASGADAHDQQVILETPDVDRRGELVLQMMRKRIMEKVAQENRPTFPPDFSLN